MDSPIKQGLYVASVAYNSDFQVGDRIISIDGAPVISRSQMCDILGGYQVDDIITVTVARDAARVDISVTLTESDVSKGEVAA